MNIRIWEKFLSNLIKEIWLVIAKHNSPSVIVPGQLSDSFDKYIPFLKIYLLQPSYTSLTVKYCLNHGPDRLACLTHCNGSMNRLKLVLLGSLDLAGVMNSRYYEMSSMTGLGEPVLYCCSPCRRPFGFLISPFWKVFPAEGAMWPATNGFSE
ncbi:hypothetical protein BDW42DRAFT_166905 [Aspergillus taichungensis]|uniref:Uncharacterized protein n=1 Tax=Aspergillus taichungensis TaxID=482145 RepID=A0A2J5HXV7_9EURO|nr:hypothetical protein BDW42DRAFT_166905 [Aspergillus taichungensis]